MSCQLFITQTLPAGSMARSVCICSPPPAHIAVRRRDLIAGLEPGWTGVCATAAKLDDRTLRAGKIGYPDIVVTVDSNRPGTRQAATDERGARVWRAIGTKQRDTAAVLPSSLMEHDSRQPFVDIGPGLLHDAELQKLSQPAKGTARPVRDPDIPLTVDPSPLPLYPVLNFST